jgi:hypothetical protein
MFLRTKDINEKTVYSAIDKLEPASVFDLRGQHSTRPNKYSSETVNSHYLVYYYLLFFSVCLLYVCTQRQFLCETLNRSKKYRLHKE